MTAVGGSLLPQTNERTGIPTSAPALYPDTTLPLKPTGVKLVKYSLYSSYYYNLKLPATVKGCAGARSGDGGGVGWFWCDLLLSA